MYIEDIIKGVNMKLLSLDKINMGIEFVPTGIPAFDFYYKGIPVGKLTSIYGAEDAGKSTLGFYVIKAYQIAYPEKYVLFLDYEKKLDPNYLELIGVDFSRVLYADVHTIEEGLEIARQRMKKENDLSLIVVDSIAGASTNQEILGDIEDANVGVKARKISQALRMVIGLMNETDTTMLFINQIRDSIGSYGGGITTPGGHAEKHHSILRMFITQAKWKDQDDGQLMNIHVNKNHSGPKGIKTTVHIDTSRVWKGLPPINPVMETVYLATERGLLHRAGSWYKWTPEDESNIAQGFNNLVEYFELNPDAYEKLTSMLYGEPLDTE